MARRPNKGIGLAAALLCLLALPGAAQEQRFGDWQLVRGPGGAECLLAQSVLSQGSGSLLVQAVLQATPEGPHLALRVPTGVSLATGIAYRVGAGAPRPLDWITCDHDLCLALRPLSAAELRALQRGREMIVGYRPLPSSPVLNLPVSLMGVTAGWQALGACTAAGGGGSRP